MKITTGNNSNKTHEQYPANETKHKRIHGFFFITFKSGQKIYGQDNGYFWGQKQGWWPGNGMRKVSEVLGKFCFLI